MRDILEKCKLIGGRLYQSNLPAVSSAHKLQPVIILILVITKAVTKAMLSFTFPEIEEVNEQYDIALLKMP